jgi:hypothetical protein
MNKTPLLIAALLAMPHAAVAGTLTLAVGPQVCVNDPILLEKGLGGTVELPLGTGLHLALSGAGYLNGGEADWSPLQAQLDHDNHVAGSISRMRWRSDLAAHWSPFPIETDQLVGHLGLRTGFGLLRTQDDLALLQQEGDEYAEASELELHPTMLWGLFMELGSDRLRGRVGLERMVWVETVSSTTLEMHRNLMLSAEVVVRWGLTEREPAPVETAGRAEDDEGGA